MGSTENQLIGLYRVIEIFHLMRSYVAWRILEYEYNKLIRCIWSKSSLSCYLISILEIFIILIIFKFILVKLNASIIWCNNQFERRVYLLLQDILPGTRNYDKVQYVSVHTFSEYYELVLTHNIHRITSVKKVETDIIGIITASVIGRAVIVELMYV